MDIRRLPFFMHSWFIFLAFVLCSTLALAQVTKAHRAELTNNSHQVFIGKNVYVHPDREKSLSFETLIARYRNNSPGTPHDSSIINLGLSNAPVWIVFSVTNTSDTEDWFMEFGDVFDGRMSMIKDIEVYNASASPPLVFKYGSGHAKKSEARIPVKIGVGKTEDFVVFVDAAGFLPSTIAPNIVLSDSWSHSLSDKFILLCSFAFFIGMTGIFAGMLMTYRDYSSIAFIVYYSILILLFVTLNDVTLVGSGFLANVLACLFPLTMIAGIFASKLFLEINARQYVSNVLLLAMAGFIGLVCLLSLLLPESSSLLKSIFVFVPCFMATLVMAVISFKQIERSQAAAYYYSLAWLAVAIGLLITGFSASGVAGTSVFSINAYWLSLVPQAVLFLVALRFRLQLDKTRMKFTQAKEIHEMHAVERLKKSKESVDQARLIRVIERERELMAELREREMKRTEEMRKARNMADEANRAKSAFLAVISHEIRTPLNGLIGTLRLISDTQLTKDQNDLLGTIRQSCDNMMVMLNDILDFEKIEKGRMELEVIRFDILKLVQDVITLMGGHARDKEISLTYDIDETIPRFLQGDPTRLRQVLLNLINNAVKFTEEGHVKLVVKNTGGGDLKIKGKPVAEIYFAIIDTGIGISKEAQKTLFDPFRQADETISRKFGGTGLGLAISKSLIETMGGALLVESQEMKGSTFYFTLTLEQAEGSAGQVSISERLEKDYVFIDPLEILIVEDNEVNRKVLRSFLEKYGHVVTSAGSGEDALELCGKQKFDVIFLDIWLPKMSGTETASLIRTMPQNPNAKKPIVAITGTTSPETLDEIKESGINGYIQKPIDFDQLLKTLAEVDKRKRERTKDKTEEIETFSTADVNESRIHQFVKSETKTTPGSALGKKPKENAEDAAPREYPGLNKEWFDEKTLLSLAKAISPEQQEELLQSFSEKADEIIKSLSAVLLEDDQKTDLHSIQARGHELKGMAANFGMSEMASIAKNIEDLAKQGNYNGAVEHIAKLPSANQNVKKVIRFWVENPISKN